MANNIVLQPAAGDTLALTAVATSITWGAMSGSIQGSAVYSTSSSAGTGNALANQAFQVAGFVNGQNNGTFLCLSSTATTITLNNVFAVAEAAAASASYSLQGFPLQYSRKIENIYTSPNGDNVSVNASAGDTLIAIAVGLRWYDPFDLLHGSTAYPGYVLGLNDYNQNPTISDADSGAPVDVVASKLSGGTLTVTYENPSAPANYFTVAEHVILSSTDEPWLNGATLTVATAPVPAIGAATATFTATAGFTAPVLTLASSDGAYVVPGQQTTTTYNGTITNGADDAFAGYTFTIAGFTGGTNNGSFVCLNSTATTLTLLNSGGVAEAKGAAASLSITEGSSAFVATAAFLGVSGNSVTIAVDDTTTGAPTVVGNAITLHTLTYTVASYVAAFPSATATAGLINFSYTGLGTDSFTTAGAVSLAGGVNSPTATATAYSNAADTGLASPAAGNVWTLATNINLVDSDYTVVSTPPPAGTEAPSTPGPSGGPSVPTSNLPTVLLPSSPYPSSQWSLDGYYPSLYVWIATGVAAGTYNVNLNSVYKTGVAPNWQYGRPIFEGGVNFQVIRISGSTGLDVGATPKSIGTSAAASATAPASLVLSAADGDMLLTIGLMKSANAVQPGSVGGTATSLVLSKVTPLNYGPAQFAQQNFGGAVYTGTITGGANNAFAGYAFTVAGFGLAVNNGTFTCTASSATTLTLSNGNAVAETHAGTAAYTALMSRIASGKLVGSEAHYIVESALTAAPGTFNPSFQNPLGYEMVIASLGLASS